MKKKSSLFVAIPIFLKSHSGFNRKWLCLILLLILSSAAFSQSIISRTSALYASVSGDEITLLQPYTPGTAYPFTIPLVSSITDRTTVTFDNIHPDPCTSIITIVTTGPDNGSLTIPASGCPFDPSVTEIRVEVSASHESDAESVTFIIPFSHKAVKVALVLDISGSMGEYAQNTFDTRWSVLSAAVLGFTELFEDFQATGDEGSLTYFTTDTIEPHSPILKSFIPIYPAGHIPASEKYSVRVLADMAPRHPLYTTAMGKGLLNGKNKLSPGSSTMKKSVVLFTDGLQNIHPYVDPADGNSVEGGLFLNDPMTTDSIKYYTIGIQSVGTLPIVLNNIASASHGKGEQTNNAGSTGWSAFFQDILVKILSNSSPQIVFRENAIFGGTEKTHQFVLNNNVTKLVVRLEFPSNAGLTMKIKKDGTDLTASAFKLTPAGPFYEHMSLSFPLKAGTLTIGSQGSWSISITGNQNCEYRLVAIADDHHLDYACKADKPLYTVGDSLLLSVSMKYNGKPLTDPANNISALVLKPGEDIGDLLARDANPALRDTSADVSSAAQQKFLYLIQTDTAFANALLPTKQLIRLVQTDSGTYRGTFSSTDLTGIYKVHFIMNGIIPDKGNFERLEVQDALFKFGLIDPKASDVSVRIDPISTTTSTGNSTASVTIRPINKFGKYLGPGFDTRVNIDVKDRKSFWKTRWIPLKITNSTTRSTITGDTIQLRKINDNLNGSYNIILANIPSKDPVIRISVMGEVLRAGRLSQICKVHSCEHLWIIIITILVILLLLLKYMLSRGIFSRIPQWLLYLIVLVWFLILILQRAGFINFPGPTCF